MKRLNAVRTGAAAGIFPAALDVVAWATLSVAVAAKCPGSASLNSQTSQQLRAEP
jgi:hypothetical protein